MKKLYKGLAASMVLATALTGCSSGGSEGSEESKELVYWSMWEAAEPQGIVIQEAVDAFNEDSDVKIKVEFKGRNGIRNGLEAALDAGQQIDIYDESDERILGPWEKYNLDLEELVADGYEDTATPALMESFRDLSEDGTLKAIPYQPNVTAIFYNKDIFEEAGVEAVPTTWDEFLDACAKIKDAGYIPLTTDDAYAMVNFGTHLTRYVGEEKTIEIVTDGLWDDPAVKKVAEDYAELADLGYISEAVSSNAYPAGQREVSVGEVAMYLNGSWLPNEEKANTGDDFNWGSFAYPAVEDGVTGTEAVSFGAQALAINKDTENAEAAFAFIEMLTTGEYDAKLAEETAGIPASTATEEWPAELADVKVIFENTTTKLGWAAGGEANTDATPVIKENFIKIMGGSITPDEFVTNLGQ